jgi:hypothetical protein
MFTKMIVDTLSLSVIQGCVPFIKGWVLGLAPSLLHHCKISLIRRAKQRADTTVVGRVTPFVSYLFHQTNRSCFIIFKNVCATARLIVLQ